MDKKTSPDEKRDEAEPMNQLVSWKLFLILAVLGFALLLVVWLYFNHFFDGPIALIDAYQKSLEEQAKKHPLQTYLLLFVIHLCVTLTFLPLQFSINLFCLLVMQRSVTCFFFLLFCCNVEAFLIYYLTHTPPFAGLKKSAENSDLYEAIVELYNEHRVMVCMEIELLLLPYGVKCATFGLLEIDLWLLFSVVTAGQSFHLFEVWLVAAEIKSFNQMYNEDGEQQSISLINRIEVVFFLITLIVTIWLTIYIAIKAKHRIQTRHEQLISQKNAKNQQPIEQELKI